MYRVAAAFVNGHHRICGVPGNCGGSAGQANKYRDAEVAAGQPATIGDRGLQLASNSEAATYPLLPVSRTLAAPILREPMRRMSPRPAARMRGTPNPSS